MCRKEYNMKQLKLNVAIVYYVPAYFNRTLRVPNVILLFFCLYFIFNMLNSNEYDSLNKKNHGKRFCQTILLSIIYDIISIKVSN